MNIHQNARLTPIRREEMARSVIAGQLSKAQAARVFGVSAKIVSRWTGRFLAEGRAGMQDRSSRPKLIPTQTAEPLAERIITNSPRLESIAMPKVTTVPRSVNSIDILPGAN